MKVLEKLLLGQSYKVIVKDNLLLCDTEDKHLNVKEIKVHKIGKLYIVDIYFKTGEVGQLRLTDQRAIFRRAIVDICGLEYFKQKIRSDKNAS